MEITSKSLIKWLRSHPLININALCEAVGYDRSNFQKAMSGNRDIPDKYLKGFEKELKKYGYK